MVSPSSAASRLASAARVASRIPIGTWCTHMHVLDPQVFSLPGVGQYKPETHTIEEAKAALGILGIEKMNIVQPSVYGNDNSCTLDGLKQLGPQNGRAFIQFDPETTSKQQLRDWHHLGVRGVRVNYKSVGAQITASNLAPLFQYADAIRDLNWTLEIYLGLEDVPQLEPLVPKLGLGKVCLAHFGHPSAASLKAARSANDLPGFESLVRLLKQDQTWVKLSASYRLDIDPRHAIVESLCKALLRTRADRMLFATDWPHTRFHDVDVSEYIEPVLDWIEDEGISLRSILVDNANELLE